MAESDVAATDSGSIPAERNKRCRCDCGSESDCSDTGSGSSYMAPSWCELDSYDEAGDDDSDDEDEEEIQEPPENAESVQSGAVASSWLPSSVPDQAPIRPEFKPARQPGVHLDKSQSFPPEKLFKLFFSEEIVTRICSHTNEQAALQQQQEDHPWTPLTMKEFYAFIASAMILKKEYVAGDGILYPDNFLKDHSERERFSQILSHLRICGAENAEPKTKPEAQFDVEDLLKHFQPLVADLAKACQKYYHPQQQIAVDEMMFAMMARSMPTQRARERFEMKADEIGPYVRLHILADAGNGYTFNLLLGAESENPSEDGYEVVKSLVDCDLGEGYELYCDENYTGSKLFSELYEKRNTVACGTAARDETEGFPETNLNGLTSRSPRGTIRWMRDGPLLFVRWMDVIEVAMVTTMHKAYSGARVNKKVKLSGGRREMRSIEISEALPEHKDRFGARDRTNQLIRHRVMPFAEVTWHNQVFLRLVYMAVQNSYILHKELGGEAAGGGHQDELKFRYKMIYHLCGEEEPVTPPSSGDEEEEDTKN